MNLFAFAAQTARTEFAMLPTSIEDRAWAEQDAKDRADDEARGARWIAFIDIARERARHRGYDWLLGTMRLVMTRGAAESQLEELWVQDFAEEFGWPNVLRAIARAMEQDDEERIETERRR